MEPLPTTLSPAVRALRRWGLLCVRLLILGGVAWLLLQLPLPALYEWLPLKNVLVAVGSVLVGGKMLYDTLFYDHFQP